jgi:CxxC-x17-CxxC domain-containing protein
MSYQNGSDERKMFTGNWNCTKCGTEITELPFEPDGVKPLFCRDCHRERVNNRPNRF